jgi:chemotaxis protein methyltransferase CheR
VSSVEFCHALTERFELVGDADFTLYRKRPRARAEAWAPSPAACAPAPARRAAPRASSRAAPSARGRERGPPRTRATARDQPRDAQSMLRLARALADGGERDAAMSWCRRSLALERLDPTAHYLLGLIEQERGESAAAARAFERAIFLEPDLVVAHVALARLAHGRGDARAARRHHANAHKLLARYAADAIVPESEGMSAAGLAELLVESGATAAAIGTAHER